MQKLLIIAATGFEIEPLLRALASTLAPKPGTISSFEHKKLKIDILVTGVGMVNTAFALGALKGNSYNFVINAGVCGSFKEDIKIGELVNVVEDRFSELGAQNGDAFLSLTEMGLGSEKVIAENRFSNPLISIFKTVKGITVNTVHGNAQSIEAIKKRLNPDVESMEGAVFLLACNNFNWKALQIRAVSNKVEVRNKENWNIPLAISNLNTFLIELVDQLS